MSAWNESSSTLSPYLVSNSASFVSVYASGSASYVSGSAPKVSSSALQDRERVRQLCVRIPLLRERICLLSERICWPKERIRRLWEWICLLGQQLRFIVSHASRSAYFETKPLAQVLRMCKRKKRLKKLYPPLCKQLVMQPNKVLKVCLQFFYKTCFSNIVKQVSVAQ